MDYMNQPQPGAGATPEMGAPQGGQPQAGGYYQFQPGVGFVPVQGQSAQGQAAQAQPAQGAAGAEQAVGAQAAMGGQAYAGAQPTAQQAAQGLYGQGMPEGAQPKFDQNKLGQVYGVMTDVMNGEAEPSQLLGLFAGTGGEFLEGRAGRGRRRGPAEQRHGQGRAVRTGRLGGFAPGRARPRGRAGHRGRRIAIQHQRSFQ